MRRSSGHLLAVAMGLITASGAWATERQLSREPWNHDLDNNDNFSPDDRWLVYDTRESETAIAGNAVIARINLESGRSETVYREPDPRSWGPGVGAANFNPVDGSVDFIRGLASATAARPYEAWRRGGVSVQPGVPGGPVFLDARDVIAPFTAGALRGGTHRHEWSADGNWIGFTYNDAVLADLEQRTGRKMNLRTIGVAARLARTVRVHSGPENHDGEMFAVVVAKVVTEPRAGSDEINRAFEDAWIGRRGYRRADGGWQRRARAFLGTVRGKDGRELTEVFVVDIPDRIDVPGDDGPLEGTLTTMPAPPRGTRQRRLTFTERRTFPGVALEPRHWVRSSPDGTRIVFLARDDAGVVQAFFVPSEGGPILQVTRGEKSIQSCVRWSPDGDHLLYVCGGAVTICGARPGKPAFGSTRMLTPPSDPSPENPVWSNAGHVIAFNRRVLTGGGMRQQIFLVAP